MSHRMNVFLRSYVATSECICGSFDAPRVGDSCCRASPCCKRVRDHAVIKTQDRGNPWNVAGVRRTCVCVRSSKSVVDRRFAFLHGDFPSLTSRPDREGHWRRWRQRPKPKMHIIAAARATHIPLSLIPRFFFQIS